MVKGEGKSPLEEIAEWRIRPFDLEGQLVKGSIEESFYLKGQNTNSPETPVNDDKDDKLRNVIHPPCIIMIIGKRGSGKTALGYRLMEMNRYIGDPYVFGIPSKAQKLLPDWIGIVQNLNEVPDGSILLIDEAHLLFSSRESLGERNKEMSRIVTLSRQKRLTLIFITHEARFLDKNIVSQADVIILRELGMLQSKFDRYELAEITKMAKEAFTSLSGDKRKWAYVYSEGTDFMGLVEVSLPTFWSSKLSHAFASSESLSEERLPRKLTKQELIAKAKALHLSGKSYREISKILGISIGTAYNYGNDYPYSK